MKNRNVEFFNLSFLDLLSGALAAVIFLFIIVPKGEPITLNDPLMVTYDSLRKEFYGVIPDSLSNRQQGDTIFAVIGSIESEPEESVTLADAGTPERIRQRIAPPERDPKNEKSERSNSREELKSEKSEEAKEEKEKNPNVTVSPSKFTGSKPDVPCKLSIEMKWASKKDNVDLYVCKDNDCVFGGKRYRDFIGYWDSGKARTSLFGSDVRTNQEAVRQFDEIIPGTYSILAQYKESSAPKTDMPIRLQVYTVNDDGKERGTEHYFKLNIEPTERTKIAVVTVGPDGEIEFQSFK